MRKCLISFMLAMALFWQPVFASHIPAGKNIKIAVIDTGISSGAISAEQLGKGYNYILKNDDTEDKSGHGTAVAGLIAGSAPAGITGIAPGAELIPLVFQTKDVRDNLQKGNQELVARAIRDAVDVYGCRVINLSIGTASENKLIEKAVEYAESKNVVVVASAGNINPDNTECVCYPAAYPTVIGVGSVNKKGRISRFSQRNESVKLVAQGEKIWTVSKKGKPLVANGTSFAAASVSGAAAALLSACPQLTAAEVRKFLCGSATDIYETGYDTGSGFGILNLEKALKLSAESHPPQKGL